jgi:hypothetical protein
MELSEITEKLKRFENWPTEQTIVMDNPIPFANR